MMNHWWAGAWLACAVVLPAAAADSNYLQMSALMSSDAVKDLLKTDVRLYWVKEPHPPVVEQSRPETYTRTSFSPSPFGGSRRHCVDAFEQTLRALLEEASTRGYDMLVDVRPVEADKALDTAEGFVCKPGYKITSVSLRATFAMSAAAANRAASATQPAASTNARKANDVVQVFSLDTALASPEAVAVVGPGLSAHWRGPVPAYRYRFGPDAYSAEADLSPTGPEAACRAAAVKALAGMVEEAQPRGYTQLIRIRSRLDGRDAPTPESFECKVNKKSVAVTLEASLASAE